MYKHRLASKKKDKKILKWLLCTAWHIHKYPGMGKNFILIKGFQGKMKGADIELNSISIATNFTFMFIFYIR